jgi:hypothetical protein
VVAVAAASRTATAQAAVQALFVGDRQCGDDHTSWCEFVTMPQQRYLHVIVHDAPGNQDWHVQLSNACTDTMPDVAGGNEIPFSGYLEVVVDTLGAAAPPAGQTVCLVLRGRNRWWVTYYAAYLDGNPQPDAAAVYPDFTALGGRPALPDLDVEYIHFSPAMAYDATPKVPTAGQTVTFTAHVVNAGGEPSPPFTYWWTLDGRQLSAGSFDQALTPGQETTVSMMWTWQLQPHDLHFQVSPAGPETSSANDSVSVRTTALKLGFWVEQSAYNYFQQNQWLFCRAWACASSDSFADWLERQVTTWNGVLGSSSYPGLAPHGVTDRVRVDEIHVVPDGALPLHGGLAANLPDASDRTVDLEWGLPARDVADQYRLKSDGPFDVDWGLLHELGHARSLADLYRFDIPVTGDFAFNFAALEGQPVYDPKRPSAESSLLRAFVGAQNGDYIYENAENQDLMSCTCVHAYSAYDVLLLNRLQGRRASCGNANPPCNLGDWFFELPPVNRIRILNGDGSPLADGSKVVAYFDQGASYTAHRFDAAHRQVLTVSQGAIQLGRDPFRAGDDRWAAGHNLLLLDIPGSGGEELCFIEPTVFNLAYWQGYADRTAGYTLRLSRVYNNACNLELPSPRVNEPFATSTLASTARISAAGKPGPASNRLLQVGLVDGSSPPRAMMGRVVRMLDAAGRVLGSATTDDMGRASLHLRGSMKPVRVVDVTDNELNLPVQ